LKLLILTSTSLFNDYVVSNLIKKYGRVLIIQENQGYARVLKRTFRRKKHSLASKINRLLFYAFFFLFLKKKTEKFFIERLNFSDKLNPDHTVSNINDEQAYQKAKEFNPDLVLVFGTSLLRKKWFGLNVPIVNSHLGIIPRYRGWMSWFWAILDENFDSVGISVHYVSKIADGGDLILQDYVDIFKLERIDFPHLLLSLTLSVNENIGKAIEKIERSDRCDLNFDRYGYEKKYPHYFEPGITDFIKFALLTRKLNRGK
jgi:hypothetical protein